jgi:myo-inositol-1(or 4)-monophosphatase
VGSTEPPIRGGAGSAGAGAQNRWLETCRGCVADIQGVLERLPTRLEREPVLRLGEGGDDTTAIDEAAELAVVERLTETGESFVLVSEELGTRAFGADGPMHVVVDPIDGSVNAKRGIPFFSFSLAIAEGPTMGDVMFGYVYDFGTGEEWTAERGRGARLSGSRLGAVAPKDPVEILAFEGTTAESVAAEIDGVVGFAQRVRIMGSLALSLCHLAAGRVDAVCSLKGARSVDIAAAQLLVRECGLAIELVADDPFEAAPLDLVPRSRVVAASSPGLVATLAGVLG